MSLEEIPENLSSVEELMVFLAKRYAEREDEPAFEPPAAPTEEEIPSPKTNMFALIIGINTYPEKESGGWKPLKGAVCDAEAMRDYLVDPNYLNVPNDEDHITTLFNEQATLEGIQNAIKALGDNPKIKKNDPILIFYAGHGSQVKAPDGWPVGDKDMLIQMLVPHDIIYKKGDNENNRARGVLDMTLGYLLAELARKKGNNVTVIFDCCNSGSATRGEEEEAESGDAVRYFEIPDEVEIDFTFPKEEAEASKIDTKDGFLTAGSDSHIILSACRHDEKAAENQWSKPPRGRFTVALLDLLKKEGANTLTYKDIISRIPPISAKQNPQCEGEFRDRILFDSKSVGRRNVRYVNWSKKDGFVLQAGEATGIKPGTKFTVYSDNQLSKKLGEVEVDSTLAFTSKLSISPGSDEFTITAGSPAFAVKAKAGQPPDVSIYLPFDNRCLETWDLIYGKIAEQTQMGDIIMEYVDPSQEATADLSINLTDDDRVGFSIVSMGTENEERMVIPKVVDIDPDILYSILHSAAHFSYHLRRTSRSHELRDSKRINVELNELIGGKYVSEQAWGKQIYVPESIGDNEIQVDNTVTVYQYNENGEEANYSIKLLNNTDRHLYVNMFFFDLDDLSIGAVYRSATASVADKAEESLPKATGVGEPGSLVIGYGSSGIGPRTFSVPDGQEVSHGVLKIFLSTESVDLSEIEQASPFGDGGRGMGEAIQRPQPMWDTISLTVRIEERRPPRN